MMIHSTKTTITPSTIQPVVDMKGSWRGQGKHHGRQDCRTRQPRLLGRRHDDVGSEFRQKKTPGFSPGVTSSNGGSGGKGAAARRLRNYGNPTPSTPAGSSISK